MQLTCYRWASEQTSWDPEAAYAQIESDHAQALEQFNSTRGSAVGGAARGALAGLAIGAIAGDPGTGAAIGAAGGGLIGARRGNVGRAASQEQFEDAANEFKVGETVRIQECAPISKSKRWEVVGRV